MSTSDKAAMGRGRGDPRVPQKGGAASSQQEGRRHLKQLEDAWMKVKVEERRGDQESSPNHFEESSLLGLNWQP